MSVVELDAELAAGVVFHAAEADGQLRGVMGIQDLGDVQLIRHSYVAPAAQGRGIGGALLEHLMHERTGPVLVGTWAAAQWAIAFYRRHGFAQVSDQDKTRLLQRYWTVPERQIETSVVLRRELGRRRPSSATGHVMVRPAAAEDSAAIFRLAQALATSFVPDPTSFARSLETLLSDPLADLLVAHHADEAPIGYLLGSTPVSAMRSLPPTTAEHCAGTPRSPSDWHHAARADRLRRPSASETGTAAMGRDRRSERCRAR
jgi:N-acetylglutamate synthase-like GNAT family acetyltransferase